MNKLIGFSFTCFTFTPGQGQELLDLLCNTVVESDCSLVLIGQLLNTTTPYGHIAPFGMIDCVLVSDGVITHLSFTLTIH